MKCSCFSLKLQKNLSFLSVLNLKWYFVLWTDWEWDNFQNSFHMYFIYMSRRNYVHDQRIQKYASDKACHSFSSILLKAIIIVCSYAFAELSVTTWFWWTLFHMHDFCSARVPWLLTILDYVQEQIMIISEFLWECKGKKQS